MNTAFDTYEANLLSLFGITGGYPEHWNPKFGSAILIPATDGIFPAISQMESNAKGELLSLYQPVREDRQPTTSILASTSGSYQAIIEGVQQIVCQSRGTVKGVDFSGRLLDAMTRDAKEKFRQRRIHRIKEYLEQQEHPILFYAIPATVPDTDLRTGELLRFATPRVMVYCPLPKTVKGARFYKQTEEDIHLLSGQVIWLVKQLCSHHTIETPEQLVTYMDEWGNYIAPVTLLLTLEKIKEHHPWLLPEEETWKALLPKPAKELRDCMLKAAIASNKR
jgi:hypothetical protein